MEKMQFYQSQTEYISMHVSETEAAFIIAHFDYAPASSAYVLTNR